MCKFICNIVNFSRFICIYEIIFVPLQSQRLWKDDYYGFDGILAFSMNALGPMDVT